MSAFAHVEDGLQRYVANEQSVTIHHAGFELVHEVDDYGSHRLVNRTTHEDSEWTGYDFIAVLGEYRATMPSYDGTFPEVFKITRVKDHEPYDPTKG